MGIDPTAFTTADLSSSEVDATALATLAQHRPDLWSEIQRHPRCYPELAQWIDQQVAPQPQRPAAKPTADEWATWFRQTVGREPSMTEYQTAVANGEIAKHRDQSVQAMTDGAKQMAAGAKGFYDAKIAPAAQRAARSAQSALKSPRNGSGRAPSTAAAWTLRAFFAVAAAGFLGIISMFMPFVSAFGYSASLMQEWGEEVAGTLGIFVLVIALAVLALLFRRLWVQITASVVATIVGVLGMSVDFIAMSEIQQGVSAGSGLVLMTIAYTAITAGGITALVSSIRARK
ncbi:MAG: hypothetical protein ACK5LO_04930 [Leucobacter sp.]